MPNQASRTLTLQLTTLAFGRQPPRVTQSALHNASPRQNLLFPPPRTPPSHPVPPHNESPPPLHHRRRILALGHTRRRRVRNLPCTIRRHLSQLPLPRRRLSAPQRKMRAQLSFGMFPLPSQGRNLAGARRGHSLTLGSIASTIGYRPRARADFVRCVDRSLSLRPSRLGGDVDEDGHAHWIPHFLWRYGHTHFCLQWIIRMVTNFT
jgi:hypothetical protein